MDAAVVTFGELVEKGLGAGWSCRPGDSGAFELRFHDRLKAEVALGPAVLDQIRQNPKDPKIRDEITGEFRLLGAVLQGSLSDAAIEGVRRLDFPLRRTRIRLAEPVRLVYSLNGATVSWTGEATR